MNIVFTGSRNMVEGRTLGMSQQQQDRLFDLLLGYSDESPTMLNGLCIGADTQAFHIARGMNIPIIGFPGFEIGNRWRSNLPADELRPVAHPKVRDRQMVEEASVCIATPCEYADKWTRGGTFYTFEYARSRGLKFHCIWPDGSLWEGPFQRIRLTEDVEPKFGLRYGVELDVYDGPGKECGIFDLDEDGQKIPNGKVWVRCPNVPAESIWRSPHRLLASSTFQLITTP